MKLALKVVMVIGLTLAILIPLAMIRGTIEERSGYRQEAVRTVASSFAGAQSLAGPVLVVPYDETYETEEKDAQGVAHLVRRERSSRWIFFPERLEIGGELKPGERRLGLHAVRVYELGASVGAAFSAVIPEDPEGLPPRRIGRPWLAYGVSDVRGLAGAPRLRVDGTAVSLEQGLGYVDGSGVHGRLAASPVAGRRFAIGTQLDLALGGTEALSLVPLARQNVIRLSSTWPHPQFNGSFLPRERKIDAAGFNASWEVSSLATSAQAQYLAGRRHADATDAAGESFDAPTGLDAIGVSLVDPVNPYLQADRATKYGILFVLLTFVGFFMFELVKQLRIHPIQYGLVGLALAIFFLLLVGLSEHIAFGVAYLVASVACIGLLGVYLSSVLQSRARGFGFAAMLALLYAALYGLLVSEDNALVLGAGLLFVILAAVMLVTRRIDWYRVSTLANAR